jgi:hypothetical protein
MLIPTKWPTRQMILCCSFLLLVAGCGLSEMFSGSSAEKITEPCIELIPPSTPTPTPIPTFVPIVTPKPSTPSQSCANASGIVLICDGKPVDNTPITVITPSPTYTIEVIVYDGYFYPCGGSVSPSGIVNVPAGATATFSLSFGTCYTADAYLDSTIPPPDYTFYYLDPLSQITIHNVNANHVVYVYFDPYLP